MLISILFHVVHYIMQLYRNTLSKVSSYAHANSLNTIKIASAGQLDHHAVCRIKTVSLVSYVSRKVFVQSSSQ